MKYFSAAIALCSVVAAPMALAQSSVTLYGVIDSGVDYTKAGNSSQSRVISGGLTGSRIGFRGVEDLGGGLSAIFRLEGGFTADDGNMGQGGRMFGREASVGLSSKELGTFTVGRTPLPYYMVQFRVDAFAWGGNGGMLSVTRSGLTATSQLAPQAVSARADNSFNYTSPAWSGFQARAMVATGEKASATGRTTSLSGTYTDDALDFVTGWSNQKGGTGSATPGEINSYTVGGSYNFGALKTFVGVTDEKNSCSTCVGALARLPGITVGGASQFRMVNVGARIPMGVLTLIGQATRIQDRSSYSALTGDRDATVMGVGFEYRLSKRTAAYGGYASVNNKNGSDYAIGTGTAQRAASFVAGTNPRSHAVSLGINHSF